MQGVGVGTNIWKKPQSMAFFAYPAGTKAMLMQNFAWVICFRVRGFKSTGEEAKL